MHLVIDSIKEVAEQFNESFDYVPETQGESIDVSLNNKGDKKWRIELFWDNTDGELKREAVESRIKGGSENVVATTIFSELPATTALNDWIACTQGLGLVINKPLTTSVVMASRSS